MSNSTTFHPISITELQKYIFDIIDEPSIANVRAAELGKDEDEIDKIKTIYQIIVDDYADIAAHPEKFNSSFSFAAAAISGYLHPYFYAGTHSISKICTEEFRFSGIEKSIDSLAEFENKAILAKNRFLPFAMFAESGRFTEVLQTQTLTNGEFQATGYLPNYKIKDQLFDLHRLYKLDTTIPKTEDFWDAAFNAFRYADKNNLGIIEANNAYTAEEDEFFTRQSNLQSKAKLKPAAILSDAASILNPKELFIDHFYDLLHSLNVETFLDAIREFDINPNAVDADGCNSFHMLATIHDDSQDLDVILENLGNVKFFYKQKLSRMFIMLYNYYDNYSELNNKNFYGNAPLHLAVKNNNPLMLACLAHFGSNIDAQDYEGNTPLILAINNANEYLVELLIKLGANRNIKNNAGQDALTAYHTRLAEFKEMAQLLDGVEGF